MGPTISTLLPVRVDGAVAHVTDAILVGVLLSGIVGVRTVVARVAYPVPIPVLLVPVGHFGAVVVLVQDAVVVHVVVAGVADAVAVDVALVGVLHVGTVVAHVAYRVASLAFRILLSRVGM